VLRESFEPSQRVHVVRADGDYLAFLPPPLPPAFELTPALVLQLSAADRALGRLAGAGQGLPNPHLISRVLLRREAVLSSRIEGTQTTLSELVLFEVEQPRDAPGDVREVYNYLRAVDHVLDPHRRLPLSLSLLREAHHILLSGVRGGYAAPGEFRTSQNWIGAAEATLHSAAYVPPPPERLWEWLDPFEKFLHADAGLPPLISIAAIHYQFEAIHPLLDGNGRVGRLLIMMLLLEWGLLPAPILDLSAYLEPRRDRYYDCLTRVSSHGDWLGWFTFFLEAVEQQARDALSRARSLHQLREEMRQRVTTARSSGLLPRLVDALFDVPVLTIPRAQDILDVTHRAATLNIDKLVDAGIVHEIGHGRRPRTFIAPAIIDAVEGRTNGIWRPGNQTW
jgi:Fic family protein